MFLPTYRLQTLTGVLRGPSTPLKEHFATRFPNAGELGKRLAAASGPILVDGGDAHPGTVGTGFDVMVRLLLNPGHLSLQMPPRMFWTERHNEIEWELTAAAGEALTAGDDDRFLQACWALAVLTEGWRSLQALLRSKLFEAIAVGEYLLDAALQLAPEDGLRQLRELREVANERLYPHLGQPVHIGPNFSTGHLLKADADLIAGGALIDLKATLGRANRAGARADTVSPLTVRQILGYALLDYDDEYNITDVGRYSARYGNLTTVPASEALELAAGEPVSIARERAKLEMILSLN